MHELALAEGVLQICEDHAKRANAEKVVIVRVLIGALSHVDPDALSFSFSAVIPGTLAEGAALEIERIPGKAWCHDCMKEVAIAFLGDACPTCSGFKLQVIAGEEMRVKEIEVT